MSRRVSVRALVLWPLIGAIVLAAGVMFVRQGGFAPFRVPSGPTPPPTGAESIARGEYLARIGNCFGCHTRRGGAPLAGGHAFQTAYGTIYSSNITPDDEHGLGRWSLEEFRHAMRHGVSRRGVLSPVFPYANFAHLEDADLDALFAWLRTQPKSPDDPPRHRLEFPASLPGAMLAWRMLYYRPSELTPETSRDEPWRRGRYLVEGVGHCAICHGERGDFGALVAPGALAGSRIPEWFAPALDAESLSRYPAGQVAHYLRAGTAEPAAAYGAMADVVARNLQHLDAADASAVESYLRTLPPMRRDAGAASLRLPASELERGDALYAKHCAGCHGDKGEGKSGKYPALSGAASLRAGDPVNAIKVTLFGAVAPSTALAPAPYTMPPFAQKLSPDEIALLLGTLRQHVDAHVAPITADDVRRLGGIGP